MTLKDRLAQHEVLETKRLRLRPVGMDDLEDMYELRPSVYLLLRR
ncbi:TPA: hypothetical protein ACGO3A_001808 [Streptococcus suis]